MFNFSSLFTKQNLVFLSLFLLLLIPNIAVMFYFNDIKGNLTMSFAYALLSILVWAFPLIFFKKKTYFVVALFLFLASPLEIIFVKSLGTPITIGFIDSVFKTNYNEAKEQITSNLGFVFFFIGGFILYNFLLFKVKNEFLPKKIRIIILSISVIFNVVIFYKMYDIQKGEQNSNEEKINIALNHTFLKYYKVYPMDLLINFYRIFSNNLDTSNFDKKLKKFKFEAKSLNKREEEEIYVLVIGETSRYSNFHINGYSRKTTPFLEKTENFLSFNNVYSCANLTSISIPQIITRANPQNKELQYKEKTILDAFEEAGYYTAWFANQSSDNPIIKRLKTSADFFESPSTEILDDKIIPEFQKIINNRFEKKFVVIHSLGSHFRYTNRYPKSFEKFKPIMNETGYENLDIAYKKEIINSYDNSILYTDYFLNLLIKNLEKTNKKAILFFLSDHGENLYDDQKKYIAHGTVNPTKYEYHIPYFIWYSKEYEKSNPEKIKILKNNINNPISSSSTFYTLLDLANIQYKNYEKEKAKSISSENYEIPKKRYMLNSENNIVEIK